LAASVTNMILFLDTEFTTLTPWADLLSLALVSDDGALEFYAERNDVPHKRCSHFVRESVLPHFGRHPAAVCNLVDMRKRLRAFVNALPEAATVACDFSGDMDLLGSAIGAPWPAQLHLDRLPLDTLVTSAGWIAAEDEYFSAGHPRHHALHDARALRCAYLARTR